MYGELGLGVRYIGKKNCQIHVEVHFVYSTVAISGMYGALIWGIIETPTILALNF